MKLIYILLFIFLFCFLFSFFYFDKDLDVSFSKSFQSILNPNINLGVILEEEVVSDSLLTNVTAETGDSNFTHLNISNTAPYDSLVGYWSFDGDKEDTKLTTAYDFSKENNDGTMIVNTLVNSNDCMYGNCAHINGTGDGIDTNNPVLDPTDEKITILLWMKPKEITATYNLVGKRQSVGNDGYNFGFRGNTAGDPFVFTIFGVVDELSDASGISAGIWYHVGITFDKSYVRFYVNGTQLSQHSRNVDISDASELNLFIGALNYDGSPSGAINGSIDEVMVFSAVLTGPQISDIYNNQSARFVGTGKQELSDQTYLNISSGNDKVNVTTTFDNLIESNLSLFLQYYESGSWSSTSAQNLTSGQNATFTIGSSSTNLTLNYTLIAGPNQTSTFYTPIVYDDIILDYYSEAVVDTTAPNVTINTPTNTTYAPNSIDFNVTALDESSMTDGGCWASIDAGVTNLTLLNTTHNDQYNATNTTVPDGEYQALFWCNDTENNVNNTETKDFSVDTLYPEITITNPTNNSNLSSTSFTLNYTFVEANPDSCWYSNNSGVANSSIVNMGTNWSLTGDEGSNNRTIYCNDSSNNLNSTIVYFTIDTTAPTITFISQYPSDVMWNSTGIFNVTFNITDANSINESSIVFFNGINHTDAVGSHWNWSYRFPESSKQPDGRRADNRNESKWWENVVWQESSDDIWSFSGKDLDDIHLNIIENSSTYYYMNLTKQDVHLLFPQTWYIERDNLVGENKTNQYIDVYDGNLVKITLNITWHDLTENITAYVHYNIEPQSSVRDLIIYVCNSSYSTGKPETSSNCQSGNHILGTDTRTITLHNSSYIEKIGAVTDGMFGNVAVTRNMFLVYRAKATPITKSYRLYYANNSIADNINFNDSKAMWTSTDDGSTWITYNATPDVFYTFGEKELEKIVYYVYACDNVGNCANSTWQEDTLQSEPNLPPATPTVTYPEEYYNVSIPFFINWTSAGDPDGDPYNASVYLYNPDGTLNITLANNNITDSYEYYKVERTDILDGQYRINITLCDDTNTPTNCSSVLTGWNFTIDNTPPYINITYPKSTYYLYRTTQDLNYTVSDAGTLDSCWYTNDSGATNSTSVSAGTNWTSLPVIVGSNNWTVWCNDSVNNQNSSNVTFTINAQTDSTYPLFFNLEDDNATLNNFGNATFNVTVAHSNGTVILTFNNTNYTAEVLSTNITWCYQESSNVSTSCGGLDTGTYNNDSNWNITQPVINTYDGDFETYGAAVFSSLATMYVNYTIPPFAVNTSLWKVKWGTTTENFTLGNCWNDGDVLEFRVFSHTLTDTGRTSWYCWDDYIRGWWALRGFTGYDNDNYKIYEEAMWWNISETVYNATVELTEPGTWIYFWNSYGDGLFENYNRSTDQSYTVNVTDIEYPQFSNYWDNNGSLVENGTAEFNVTITSTNGTVWINFQGESDVMASNSTADVYNVTVYVSDTNVHEYFWTAYGNGTSHNSNNSVARYYSANVSTVPEVNITYPIEDEIYLTLTLDLNYTVFDDLDLAWCWWNNGTTNSTAVSAGTNWTGLTAGVEGKNNWTVWCNDTKGNENYSRINFYAYEDIIPPNVTVNSPLWQFYNTSVISFNVTAIDAISGVDSCWFTWDNWATNYTMYNSTSNDDYNYTNTTMSDGNYKVRFACNDSILNNVNDSEAVEFDIDTIYPDINITYPKNNTDYADTGISINYTTFDVNIDSCWYHNDTNPVNTTLASCTNISGVTWSIGTHNVTIWANDSANNVNSSYVNFSISAADTTYPEMNITNPTNNSNLSSISFTLNYTYVETNPDSCWYSNNSGVANSSIVSMGTNWSLTGVEGSNNRTIYCNDTTNNLNSSIVYFTIDTTYPQINITYPVNNTNTTNTALDVNYTVSDTNLDSCWYSNDTMSANTTLPSCTNITTINWTEGNHNVTIWVNDSANNVNSSSVTFTIDISPPSFTVFANQTLANTTSLNYDIDAEDTYTEVDCFTVNNTDFDITCTGVLTNATNFAADIYWINITVNDSLNNVHSEIMFVNYTFVADTTPPYFITIANYTHTVNTSFSETIVGGDDVAVDSYVINDTSVFNINISSGVLTNVTALVNITIYYLNVTINDTSNNLNSSVFWINITKVTLSMNIISPTNTTYGTSSIDINLSTTGTPDIYWYSLDEADNVTFTPNETIIIGGWEVWHDLTIYVNDTAGTELSETRRFFLGTEQNFWVWFDLFAIFFLLLILGTYWKDFFFLFISGCLSLLMGIWVFNDGITIYGVTGWWIYPFAWILVGLGIIITIGSAYEFLEDMEGGDF